MKKSFLKIVIIAFWINQFFSGYAKAQVGVGPAPYCMPDYSNVPCNQPNASNNAANSINDFIDSFFTTGATNNVTNNNTGCNSQVLASTSGNFYFVACPIYLRVNPGQTITCNYKSGIIFDQGFAVFIDWSKNNIFDLPSERVCATNAVPPAATWASGSFVVPAAQAAGLYRMRVRSAYFTTGIYMGPCESYGFGETEDYNLIVGAAGTCPLPIELISYEATYDNKSVELTWITATELNSDYFTLERSYDNKQFDLIASLPAAGNSEALITYHYFDKNVKPNSIVYYRLKQYDKGNPEAGFSKLITIYTNSTNKGFDIYPNPANTSVNLVFPDNLLGEKITVSIFDNNGKAVFREEMLFNNSRNLTLDISKLLNGLYHVTVSDESGTYLKKTLTKE